MTGTSGPDLNLDDFERMKMRDPYAHVIRVTRANISSIARWINNNTTLGASLDDYDDLVFLDIEHPHRDDIDNVALVGDYVVVRNPDTVLVYEEDELADRYEEA